MRSPRTASEAQLRAANRPPPAPGPGRRAARLQPFAPAARSPRLVTRLLLGGSSLLLALLLAEALLRVLPLPNLNVLGSFQSPPGSLWKDPAWSDPPDRAFRRHRVLGHEHTPSLDLVVPLAEHTAGSFRFHTNNLGLRRDNDMSSEKPADLFRVLVLGDSQTEGYVDNPETFSSGLESELRLGPELAGRTV